MSFIIWGLLIWPLIKDHPLNQHPSALITAISTNNQGITLRFKLLNYNISEKPYFKSRTVSWSQFINLSIYRRGTQHSARAPNHKSWVRPVWGVERRLRTGAPSFHSARPDNQAAAREGRQVKKSCRHRLEHMVLGQMTVLQVLLVLVVLLSSIYLSPIMYQALLSHLIFFSWSFFTWLLSSAPPSSTR